MKRLDDVIGDNSIFTRLSTHVLPWADDPDFNDLLLDFEYTKNFSGNKIVSPAVLKSLDPDTGELSTSDFNKLCDIVYMMYAKKWSRYWSVLTAEYDPIKNYDMEENEETNFGKKSTLSGTDTLNMTGTDTHNHTGDDTTVLTGGHSNTHTGGYSDTHTGGQTDTHTGSIADTGTTQANNVSGFNSSSLVPSSETTNVGKNTRNFNNEQMQTVYNADTMTRVHNADVEQINYNNETSKLTHGHSDAEVRNMSDSTIYGKVDTASGKDTRKLTRSGNIGVTTSQQMLESDIALWKWSFFYDVFKDIDTVFTISTY